MRRFLHADRTRRAPEQPLPFRFVFCVSLFTSNGRLGNLLHCSRKLAGVRAHVALAHVQSGRNAICLLLVTDKPFGLTFLDVSVAFDAQVSYFEWFGGSQVGK